VATQLMVTSCHVLISELCILLEKQKANQNTGHGLDVPHHDVEGEDANRQKTNSVIHTTHLFLIFILTML
jgi:hypothetical protein